MFFTPFVFNQSFCFLILFIFKASCQIALPAVKPEATVEELAGTPEENFSEKISYADLYDDGTITIGIYLQNDREITFKKASVDASRVLFEDVAKKRKIEVHEIKDEKDFREALAKYDVVIFSGHGNIGRGLNFGTMKKPQYFKMGKDVAVIPSFYADEKHKYLYEDEEVIGKMEDGSIQIRAGAQDLEGLEVKCDVLAVLCCRGVPYYAEVFNKRFPDTEFVSTRYECGFSPGVLLDRMVRTFANVGTSKALLEDLNKSHKLRMLEIKYREKRIYKNPQSEDEMTSDLFESR